MGSASDCGKTNQKQWSDMGSDASSDVTSRGDSGGVPECRLFSEATTKCNYVVKFVNLSRVLPKLKKKNRPYERKCSLITSRQKNMFQA